MRLQTPGEAPLTDAGVCMQLDRQRETHRVREVLVFGVSDGDRVEVGPFSAPLGAEPLTQVDAEVVLWVDDEDLARRSPGNGFEALSLLNLRADLSLLRRNKRGSASFGDHDYGRLIDLTATSDGRFSVSVTLPNADLWWQEVTSIGQAEIDDLIATVGHIEDELGDLSGFFGCCGVPEPTYDQRDGPPEFV